ncbi:hypothetical protein HDV06_003846 [Boothiomyces sp. JEL0866]|nr:hypothetical protein HDV06_003846 [Boothiomyces sp. JEL0866]
MSEIDSEAVAECMQALAIESNTDAHQLAKTKDKKKKKPKPGSKAAQLLKTKAEKSFTKPTAYLANNVLIIYFTSSLDLKNALMNVHLYYEKQELKGPLKGVNFPIAIYNEWSPTVTEFTEGEQLIHSLITSNHADYLIAGLKGDQSTFLHEWAHAVYFASAEYRDLITRLFSSIEPTVRQAIEKELLLRFVIFVFEDEFQAYVRESPADFGKKYTSYLSETHQQLKKHVQFPKLSNPIDL